MEAALRAYRAARLGMLVDRLRDHATTSGLDTLTEDDIAAEVATVREERHSANATTPGR